MSRDLDRRVAEKLGLMLTCKCVVPLTWENYREGFSCEHGVSRGAKYYSTNMSAAIELLGNSQSLTKLCDYKTKRISWMVASKMDGEGDSSVLAIAQTPSEALVLAFLGGQDEQRP